MTVDAGPTTVVQHYDPGYYQDLAEAERSHFWFVYRNRVIDWCARRFVRAPVRRALEVGCGTGNVLRVLQRVWPDARIIGMELFEDGLRFARARSSAALVCGRVEQMPFAASFDVVGMFDVLEHIPDDVTALKHIHERMHGQSRLLVTVPASPGLWSDFDVRAGHVRRYDRSSLARTLSQGGFHLEYVTPFMLPLVPLVWLHRRARSSSARDVIRDELKINPLVNAVCGAALSVEFSWLRGGAGLFTGTSLLAVARKS